MPEFCAFLDILCSIQQKCFSELGPNRGGKTLVIAGSVVFFALSMVTLIYANVYLLLLLESVSISISYNVCMCIYIHWWCTLVDYIYEPYWLHYLQ